MFGPSGTVKIDRKFHLFATMNPADYAGRSVLSPAFRDRWLLWHQAEVPGEAEFGDMLRFLVLGEHPEFVFQGKTYFMPPGQPVYPALGAVPNIRQLLPPLALFHSSLCQGHRDEWFSPGAGAVAAGALCVQPAHTADLPPTGKSCPVGKCDRTIRKPAPGGR